METIRIIVFAIFLLSAIFNLIVSIKEKNQQGIGGWICAILWAIDAFVTNF